MFSLNYFREYFFYELRQFNETWNPLIHDHKKHMMEIIA